jgi:hypothetical protein
MFYIIGAIGIWVLSAILFYVLDGWFDYGFNDDRAFFFWAAVTCIVWIWIAMPIVAVVWMHDSLKKKKGIYVERKNKELKMRIAQEKEVEEIQKELELSTIDKDRTQSV